MGEEPTPVDPASLSAADKRLADALRDNYLEVSFPVPSRPIVFREPKAGEPGFVAKLMDGIKRPPPEHRQGK